MILPYCLQVALLLFNVYVDIDNHAAQDVIIQFMSPSLSAEDSELNKCHLRIFRLPHPRTSKKLQRMNVKASCTNLPNRSSIFIPAVWIIWGEWGGDLNAVNLLTLNDIVQDINVKTVIAYNWDI